ncbi:MAG: alpha/beta fold hydrolase [Burkholderiales bacterium]
MRARNPDQCGKVERARVRIHFEVFGDGAPTILLMATWSIVHSRAWKAQIPYLARHFRVVTYDGRGNGKSDRPAGASAYVTDEFVADAIAVLDATSTDRAVLVAVSLGAHHAAVLAARHPERVLGAVLIAPSAPFGPSRGHITPQHFLAELDSEDGWAKYNQHYWKRDFRGFAEFFFSQLLNEPHSTKQIEDSVGWAMETSPDTLIDTVKARFMPHEENEALYASIGCPVLVLHGDRDEVMPCEKGKIIAQLTRGEFILLEGSGHLPQCRDPALVNLAIRDFVNRLECRPRPMRTLRRGAGKRRRVLYLSSPIGLGHARRDLAIASELRALHPEMEIHWLTQHPVTRFLEGSGEAIHPASERLVNESKHIETEAGEHDLHCFQALRRMDEILVANFMLFQEVVEDGSYDLVVADESWDVDHFWHEHPELKRAPLAWFTDFVGYVPMPQGGDREAFLTADYNAEMLEHIERFPRVRDRALFVGNPEDIVPGTFGPSLPGIREWTESHFDFCGYITGFDPRELSDRAELRGRFGFGLDEKVCIVSVGGSGVGGHLLRRVLQSFPLARRKMPELRMIVVAGPRIAPQELPSVRGVEIHGYLPDLYLRQAACDLAVVQGGLTTCMELTAARVPFLYFPLHNHFEQNIHVRYRLDGYGAGRRMEYALSDPDEIAAAIVDEIGRPVNSREVESDGARRAAALLAGIL